MANYDPLQEGDQAPNFSRTDSSRSADRRGQDNSGSNAAPQAESPMGSLWRHGTPAPNSFLSAPFNVITTDEGAGDRIVEVDIFKYGDAFDQNAPTRVRNVDRDWQVDTDHDGEKN